MFAQPAVMSQQTNEPVHQSWKHCRG